MSFNKIFQRFLIFSFIFLFAYSKLINLENSTKDFIKRLKYNLKFTKQGQNYINSLDNISDKAFISFMGFYALLGIFSIFNYKIFQFLAGYFTLMISVLYCNPFKTIEKNFAVNKYGFNTWKNYIPSFEFIQIFGLSLIMMFFSFMISKSDENKKFETYDKSKNKVKQN